MEIIIKIRKEDIRTKVDGDNYLIFVDNNLRLSFTPEAIEELYSDYKSFEEDKIKEVEVISIEE